MIPLFIPLGLATAASVLVAALTRRVHPAHAAWLTASAIGAVFFTVLVAAWAISLSYLAHEPLVGDMFAWCLDPLRVHPDVPRWMGVPALVVAPLASVRTVRVVRAWCRHRGVDAAAVHVVRLDRPVAYAQTGRGGGVVVSTGMLAALQPDERRAVLAHELAHLRHRHDRFLVIGQLAGGLPLLRPAAKQLRHALERWADEDAAAALGDRVIVARAVARAALVGHAPSASQLGMIGADVPRRVEALLGPPPPVRAASVRPLLAGAAVFGTFLSTTLQLHHLAAIVSAVCRT